MINVKEFLEAVNIADVVTASGVELKHDKACCPFHSERTPSFSVSRRKNIFKCFGCGIGGDAIKYIELYFGLDFKGAVQWISDQFGLGVKIGGGTERESREKRAENGIERVLNKIYMQRFKHAEGALIARFRELHSIINEYHPPRGTDICDFPSEYVNALNEIDRIEYYCDVMATGTMEDKKDMLANEGVKSIEHRYYSAS